MEKEEVVKEGQSYTLAKVGTRGRKYMSSGGRREMGFWIVNESIPSPFPPCFTKYLYFFQRLLDSDMLSASFHPLYPVLQMFSSQPLMERLPYQKRRIASHLW